MGFDWQPVSFISDRFLNIFFIGILSETSNAMATAHVYMKGNDKYNTQI